MATSPFAEVWGSTGPEGTSSPLYEDRTKTVTADATGSGDGSVADPWTLKQACELAVAGDVVGVEAGFYPGERPSGVSGEGYRLTPTFRPSNSGTESEPITFVAQFRAALEEGPYSELASGGSTEPSGWGTGSWPVFGSLGSDHIHWIGFYTDGRRADNRIFYDCGYCTTRNNTGFRMQYCKIKGDLDAFNEGKRNYTAIRVENTEDTVAVDNYAEDFAGATNTAFVILYYARRYEFRHNHVKNCEHGFHYKGGFKDEVNLLYGDTSYNRIENCHHAFRFHCPALGPNGERNRFAHNLILNCSLWFEQTSSSLVDRFDAADFRNNTVVGGAGDGPAYVNWVYKQTPKDNTSLNNIFSGGSYYQGSYSGSVQDIVDHMASDYNCLHGFSRIIDTPAEVGFSDWKSTYGQDIHSITDDPEFVGGGDYRLQDTSPCRGAGDGGQTIGCYQTDDEQIGIRPAT